MNKQPWPFDQPQNCAVITLRSIVFGDAPILHVSRDEDDHGWQFLGLKDADFADSAVVAFAEIVGLDETILQLADLPPGWRARRQSKSSPWIRERM